MIIYDAKPFSTLQTTGPQLNFVDYFFKDAKPETVYVHRKIRKDPHVLNPEVFDLDEYVLPMLTFELKDDIK